MSLPKAITVENLDGYWAFDYERQVWVQGEPALHLMIEQVKAELAILSTDRGPAYWDSIKGKVGKSCYEYTLQLEELLISYLDVLTNLPVGEYLQ